MTLTSKASINNYSEFTVKQRKNCSWVRFLIWVVFLWCSGHHCPMEVGAYWSRI